MNLRRRLLVAIPVVILLCLALAAMYEYAKPHAGAGNKKTDLFVDAHTLYSDFATDETRANSRYLDKIIEVIGKVSRVDSVHGATIVLLDAGDLAGGISCKMFALTPSIKTEQKITIKGKCSGFLADVNLVDCVVESQ